MSSDDPTFGSYNMLNCRNGKMASFPLNASISNKGLIVAMDYYPFIKTSATQTVFSIRNTDTGFISLRLDYILAESSLNIWYEGVTGAYYVFQSSTTALIPIAAGNYYKKCFR